jgi:crossover junction endodeoxyribonuclease RuvC
VIVVAIDPGQRCGWAVRYPSGSVENGVWLLKPDRFSNMGSAMMLLRSNLETLFDQAKPDIVGFEEVRRHRGVDAAHWYGAITSRILEVCEVRQIPCRGIPVATVKKRATGKGNADKLAVFEAARVRFPNAKLIDDNDADALWIAECIAASVPAGVEGAA